MKKRNAAMRNLGLIPLIAVASAMWAVPSDAEACHPVTVCPRWQVNSSDSGVGEDHLTDVDDVPARGARVMIIPPPPEPPVATWLDREGCVTFETQYAYGIKMVLYADALLGQDNNIYVRAYGTDAVTETTDTFEVDLDSEYAHSVDLHGMASGDIVAMPVPANEVTSLLAYAAETVYRVDEVLGAHLEGPQQLNVIPGAANNANLETDLSGVRIGPNVRNKKYVVAHEVGHWFQWKWTGGLPGELWAYNYGYAPQDEPCQFPSVAVPANSSSHGIRSAEYSSGAAAEGFAHFIAAVAFNDTSSDDGIFKYYKTIDPALAPYYADLVESDYRISLKGGTEQQAPLGGQSRWVATECAEDWGWPYSGDPSAQEVTSEIDWMRFFWAFVASQQAGLGDPADVADVLEVVTAAEWTDYVVWSYLVDAIENHPDIDVSEHTDRFLDLNPPNGVYNDDS